MEGGLPQAVVVFTGVVVFAQMLDVGLRYRTGDGQALFGHPGLAIRSFVSALVVVPLAAFGLVMLLPLPTEVAVGLAILAASPGAPLTTRRSEAAGADRAYVSTLQISLAASAVVFMPLVLAAFDGLIAPHSVMIEAGRIAMQVATVTFVPLVIGRLIVRFAPEALRHRAGLLSRASKLLFWAFLAAILLALAFLPDLRQTLLIGWVGAGAIVALAAAALVSGHALGGPRPDRRSALAIASVTRNLGLAIYVAEVNAETIDALPAILTYAVLAKALAMPYSRWAKSKAAVGMAGGGTPD